MLKSLFLLATSATLAIAAAPAPETGTVTVRVTNLRNAKGRVHVDLCPEAHFLKDDCPYVASSPAQAPVTVLVVRNIPPGRYAAQLFHDENVNDKMDRGLFGIPKEGFAFSRDAPIHMSPPKWREAEFVYPGGLQTIQVKMRYFLGQPGPQGR